MNLVDAIYNLLSHSKFIWNDLSNPNDFNILWMISCDSNDLLVKSRICAIFIKFLAENNCSQIVKESITSWSNCINKLKAVVFDLIEGKGHDIAMVINGLILCEALLIFSDDWRCEIIERLENFESKNYEISIKILEVIEHAQTVEENGIYNI